MSCKCYHADKNFLGKIGVCWGTKECEACSCGGDEAKCDFYDYVRERAKKIITNGERVRQSDENVVELFLNSDYPWCDNQCEIDATGTVLYCEKCLLKWLKEEVQE